MQGLCDAIVWWGFALVFILLGYIIIHDELKRAKSISKLVLGSLVLALGLLSVVFGVLVMYGGTS